MSPTPRAARRPVDGILVLDKPPGMTSNAALQRVKRLYAAQKAGHTGALDPLATGVLPICLGQATKLSGYLLDADKRYLVRATVGACTDTGDADGEVTRRSDAAGLTRERLEAALPQFTGEIHQRPPMYSALKRDGQPLYELARAGVEVEREPRAVTIHLLLVTGFEPQAFELDVRCSKGTYIRTLVEDLAAAAGQCAHVAALRRVEAGPFRETDLVTPEALERAAEAGPQALDALLRPPLAGLASWPAVQVGEVSARRLAHGQTVEGPAGRHGLVAVTGAGGVLLGIAEQAPDGLLTPRRWLAPP
ncbi:MAG: tRNA pseudouridine(55) synthase TruB [Gammaproteobacteria bacterium]